MERVILKNNVEHDNSSLKFQLCWALNISVIFHFFFKVLQEKLAKGLHKKEYTFL